MMILSPVLLVSTYPSLYETDPFLYYSIAAVREAELSLKEVDYSEISQSARNVTRKTRVSFENHTNLVIDELLLGNEGDGLEESDLGELDELLTMLFFNTQWVNSVTDVDVTIILWAWYRMYENYTHNTSKLDDVGISNNNSKRSLHLLLVRHSWARHTPAIQVSVQSCLALGKADVGRGSFIIQWTTIRKEVLCLKKQMGPRSVASSVLRVWGVVWVDDIMVVMAFSM